MDTETNHVDQAFSQGSDARLRGDPFLSPYPPETNLHLSWRRGWSHCHRHWGEDAKRTIKPLPRLREAS